MLKLMRGVAMLALLTGAAQAADGNAKDGEDVFRKCRACHDAGPGARNKLGPILNGIVGRKAASVEGYNYSPANKKAGQDGWVWTDANLDKYLANPRAAMPGNRMSFAGLTDEQDRADVIAYLKTQTGK
ncbi:MAG: cytochrome c family protein [Hyphomicrobiaceae bacterium]